MLYHFYIFLYMLGAGQPPIGADYPSLLSEALTSLKLIITYNVHYCVNVITLVIMGADCCYLGLLLGHTFKLFIIHPHQCCQAHQ